MSGMEKNPVEEIWGIDRTQWGRWKLDGGYVAYHGAPEHPGLDYPIDTAQLATPAQVWTWVRQLEEKTWCTEQDLEHFVRAAIATMRHHGVLGDPPVPPTVMSPWHPDWGEFLQQLTEEIGLTKSE